MFGERLKLGIVWRWEPNTTCEVFSNKCCCQTKLFDWLRKFHLEKGDKTTLQVQLIWTALKWILLIRLIHCLCCLSIKKSICTILAQAVPLMLQVFLSGLHPSYVSLVSIVSCWQVSCKVHKRRFTCESTWKQFRISEIINPLTTKFSPTHLHSVPSTLLCKTFSFSPVASHDTKEPSSGRLDEDCFRLGAEV